MPNNDNSANKGNAKPNVIKWILLISLVILIIRIIFVLPAALEHHSNKQLPSKATVAETKPTQ
jgi:hypothetical protein